MRKPIKSLSQSRKALIATVTILLNVTIPPLALFFVGKYAPSFLDDTKLLLTVALLSWTAISGVWIRGIAAEDAAAKASGLHLSQLNDHNPETME